MHLQPAPYAPFPSCRYTEASDVPVVLFHGTAQGFLRAILEQGLQRMTRQYVHMTTDEQTALKVGE